MCLQVCVANPPAALTSAGCAPVFPPGCDCEAPHIIASKIFMMSGKILAGDPEAAEADSTCAAGSSCVQCKCLPEGCDCDPEAEDPNSFCASGDVCKVKSRAVNEMLEYESLKRRSIRRFVITEKAPTRAFSWLKAATTAFTFKTLLRHYAKWALTPRYLNVKLGPRRKCHKGRAGWLVGILIIPARITIISIHLPIAYLRHLPVIVL